MLDSLKVVRKNFIVAFKYDIKNFIGFLPLIYIGYLIFNNVHDDILNPLQIMSSFGSAGIVYAIVDSFMTKENIANASIVMKSLPLKQSNIVIGIYVFTALIILSTALVASIFPAMKVLIEGNDLFLKSTFIINIVFCILIFSILLPFTFKFEYLKSRRIFTIIINGVLPLAILYYYIQALYTKIFFIPEAEYIINLLSTNIPVTIAGCLILYLISMAISIKAYYYQN